MFHLRRRRSLRSRVLVVASVVTGAALIIGGVFWVARSSAPAAQPVSGTVETPAPLGPDSQGQPPIVENTLPDEATALTPLTCTGNCFGSGDPIQQLILPTPVLDSLGFTIATGARGDRPDVQAGELSTQNQNDWITDGGTPVACASLAADGPVDPVVALTGSTAADPIVFMGSVADAGRIQSVQQTARVFPDSASAVAYVQQVSAEIANCARYSFQTVAKSSGHSVTRSGLEMGLPPSVAAIGFRDSGYQSDRAVVDLQRGNLVIRSTVTYSDPTLAGQPAFTESPDEVLEQLCEQEARLLGAVAAPGAVPAG